MPELVGQTHIKLLHWLNQDWLQEGPPICFLEGFPGVGKSYLARELIRKVVGREVEGGHGNWAAVMEDMPENSSDAVETLLARLSEILCEEGHHKIADAMKEGKSLEQALYVVLRRPILIVVDEFQRALLPETGQPIPALETIFQRIANRPNFPGRLLVLTNRLIEPGTRWSEPYAIKRLPALEILEAEQFLAKLLREKNKEEYVPIERRRDVVKWLGRNPRAMEVLVGCVGEGDSEPLDKLIGISPESWELREREASEDFLYKLEERLLERTLNQLAPESMLLMKQLAVYRKPFKRKTMESLLAQPKKEFSRKFAELTNRFLLERPDNQWHSLHPVARAIVLQRLKEEINEWKLAHSKAADFYVKPFFKQDIDGSKLGGSFLEARYHLVQSGREKELGKIAKNFEQYLKATTKTKQSIPKQPEELDENILVFSVLAEAIYSEELEYYLARLLQARRKQGDLEQALKHAQQATAAGLGLRVSSWLLRAELELQLRDPETALATCQQGIKRVSVDEDVAQLYDRCTELLKRCDRVDEAIKLLENGIQQTPSGSKLTALYQQGATLLTQAQELERAVVWLKQGILKVAPEHRLVKLYQHCAELLCQMDQIDEAMRLLEEGIERIPPEHGLNQLYQCFGNLLVEAQLIPAAIELLKEGIHNIPQEHDPFMLYERCAELLIQSGYVNKAIELLQDSFQKLPSTQSQIPLYERWGQLLAKTGQKEAAITLLQGGIAKIPSIRGPVGLYLTCGKLLAELGQLKAAADLLRQGIKEIPSELSDWNLYKYCAELLEKLGEIDQAVPLLKDGIESIRNYNGIYELYRYCAELLEKSAQIDEAANLLRQGISRIVHNDTCKKLFLACGMLLKRHNRINEAIALFKQGIERIPPEYNVQELYTSCSNLLAQTNQVDEAIKLLQQGIERIPPESSVRELYTSCSNLLAQTNQVDEAIKLLQQGIERIPPEYDVRTLYTSCSNLLARTNQVDEAIKLLQQGIERIPPEYDVRELYTSCSNLLARTNQVDEAIKLLQQGLALLPQQVPLYIYLGNFLAQAGRVDEAIKLLQEGIERIRHSGVKDLYISGCNFLAQAGRVDEASKLLQKGIERIPPDKDLISLYLCGQKFLIKDRRFGEARKLSKDGLRKIPTHHLRYRLAESLVLICIATQEQAELEEILAATDDSQLDPASLALGQILLAQLQENWQRAAEIASESVTQFPKYMTLTAQAAFAWLSVGNPKTAQQILQNSPLQLSKGIPTWWLKAFIDLRNNDLEAAQISLENYLCRNIQVETELTESFLLSLWDTPGDLQGEVDLAFYFPMLPPIITGLDTSITRVQFSPPVLPN